jgi:dihydroorotate dehydrogenase (NAD+) catalytic subunit
VSLETICYNSAMKPGGMAPDMTTSIAGVQLRSPLIAAAGTCGYVGEFAAVLDTEALGALTSKSISPQPWAGNEPWRIIDLPRCAGMLNAIGLANVGLRAFLRDKLPAASALRCAVIGSVCGRSIDDYVQVAAAFDAVEALQLVELNVSCPNTADGLLFGDDPRRLGELLRAVRPALRRTKMIVKLSPNVGDIVALARAAIDAGADALTLVNTLAAMAIDVESRQPRLSRGCGGLSGPAIHPVAVRMVHEVHHGVARDANVPIIGVGGVMHWADAAEFILAGATGVGLGTALFVDPALPVVIGRGLRDWVARLGCASITELVGQVQAA